MFLFLIFLSFLILLIFKFGNNFFQKLHVEFVPYLAFVFTVMCSTELHKGLLINLELLKLQALKALKTHKNGLKIEKKIEKKIVLHQKLNPYVIL